MPLLETQLHADFRRPTRRCSQTHWKKQLIYNRIITPKLITGELDSLSTPPKVPRNGTVEKLCPNPSLKGLRYAVFSSFFLFFSLQFFLHVSSRTDFTSGISGFIFQNKTTSRYKRCTGVWDLIVFKRRAFIKNNADMFYI